MNLIHMPLLVFNIKFKISNLNFYNYYLDIIIIYNYIN